MHPSYSQSNFDQFKREMTTIVDGDGSNTVVTSLKSPSPTRKNRILSHKQGNKRSVIDDLRTSRTQTASNRLSAKLPHLNSNPNVQSKTSESMRTRVDLQSVKDTIPSTPGKLERQSTTMNPPNRLPTLYSILNPEDQKRIANLRRRQIYALNHLMRELEQEQFRQYCQLNNIGASTNVDATRVEAQITAAATTTTST